MRSSSGELQKAAERVVGLAQDLGWLPSASRRQVSQSEAGRSAPAAPSRAPSRTREVPAQDQQTTAPSGKLRTAEEVAA